MAGQTVGQRVGQRVGQTARQIAEHSTKQALGNLPQAAGPHELNELSKLNEPNGLATATPSSAETQPGNKKTLQTLLQHPQLWQAGKLPPVEPTHTSGFASLDENLPGHGWPQAGLAEFMFNAQGIGELQLLVPLLKRLSQEDRWIAWVNPPLLPYAPALAEHGIDLAKILLIHPKSHKDALWAMECASKSGTCSVVLGWLDERKLKPKDTRRLQLAAKNGNTFSCLFRPEHAAQQPSMAELRISLKAPQHNAGQEHANNPVSVTIEKRRRGWPVADLPLRFTHAPYAATEQQNLIHEQLQLWRSIKQKQTTGGSDSPENEKGKGKGKGSGKEQTQSQDNNAKPELTPTFNDELPAEVATIVH